MFLKRLVLVNWGNIPNGEFEMGPVNLLSGANGSGKTTAADAVQTIMTAAHENLFHYNPGQEESTQRGRGGKRVRTLASYVLGCDDGSYARIQPTDGYIAAVFHPTTGESAEAFTAVIAVRAWLDRTGKQPLAREDEIRFFIVKDAELSIGTFLHGRAGAQQVVLLDEIDKTLIKRHGKSALESYDQKRTYLRRLYGALRGKRDSVSEREAMAAARAFSRFMAYKPVSSITQFVADEVLERKDLGDAVRSVSSQLKTIHSMEREAQSFKDSVALLGQAGHQAQAYIDAWVERITLDYAAAQSVYLLRQDQYLKTRNDRDAVVRRLTDNAEELRATEQRREQLHGAVVMLEAQRQTIEPLRQKDRLAQDQKSLEVALTDAARELLRQDRQLQQSQRAVRALEGLLGSKSLMSELPDLTDMQVRHLVTQARANEKAGDIDLPGLLQRDLTGDLAMLERHLEIARGAQQTYNELTDYWRLASAGESNRRDRLAAALHDRRQTHEQISQRRQQKLSEVERLEARQNVYPPYVERALAAIRGQYPTADARVLCDHIDVTDERWQSAIEGYLGGARFSIIVDEAFEADAIRLVRAMSGRDNRARVLQGAKALRDASRSKPAAESILHVMRFTHKVAEAFMTATYGSVVRVDSAEELRHTPRGVTADGMGSGNYAMFRCDIPDADLVFGAAARERALRARRVELQELDTSRQAANLRLQETTRFFEAVEQLQPLAYADTIAELLAVHRDIRSVQMLLSQLDVTAWQSLDAQLAQLREEEKGLWRRIGEIHKHSGELEHEQQLLGRRIDTLSEQKDAAQDDLAEAEEQLRTLHAGWPEFDLDARLRYADQEARSLDESKSVAAREEIEARLRQFERALDSTIQQHNQKCRPSDVLVYGVYAGAYDTALFRTIGELRREIDRIYNVLRNNVLVEKHENLKQLKSSFNEAFVAHLCQEIHQAIVDGKRQLELLNKELVNHRFGSDREQFRFEAEWVPEYRDYANFFAEVMRTPGNAEGRTLFDAKLPAKAEAVRDSIMSLLLGADEQKSLRELERIADYRNYYRYEIYKDVEGKTPIALSEYGTGSGGQLETPAYIIRAASITSALRYAEGVNHLRMVLVDEAFSKMDETRSREVIAYLTGTLGLQLLFIMPTSKCGPFMDLISNEFVFAKIPSPARGELHTRVLVDRKQCNQERIKVLWAQHRRTVQQQAEMDFMDDIEAATSESR
ncbi:ATP-binding protein [Povalibacter sp.]|uniref:ATP-binding protein n=1 Tax=Povalibacter sp. TaxID=1962978 RepID=UPI002F42C386